MTKALDLQGIASTTHGGSAVESRPARRPRPCFKEDRETPSKSPAAVELGTCGGKPRIEGHRITVKHIVLDYQRGGMSPDEIVSAYPTLTLSDVHAALAYYYDHQAEIDADIKEDDDHWAEIQRQNPGRLIDRLRNYLKTSLSALKMRG